MKRRILHLDFDAFFASVELLDKPHLQSVPVVVGGKSNRGVVTTCNYEARKYGIHSAMPLFQAKKRYPDLVVLTPHFDRYSEISRRIFGRLRDQFENLEQVSIDEAYIDITRVYHPSALIARTIKRQIMEGEGLTVSIGISYNKFLAKLASEWQKPDGYFEIREEDVPEILRPLPLKKIHGLGKVSIDRLNGLGIFTVADLMHYPLSFFEAQFGRFGREIYERIRGIDHREVTPSREMKSFGKESTLDADVREVERLESYLAAYAEELAQLCEARGVKAHTITLKVKYADFESVTRQRRTTIATAHPEEIRNIAVGLLRDLAIDRPVRLIGIYLSSFETKEEEQLSFLS